MHLQYILVKCCLCWLLTDDFFKFFVSTAIVNVTFSLQYLKRQLTNFWYMTSLYVHIKYCSFLFGALSPDLLRTNCLQLYFFVNTLMGKAIIENVKCALTDRLIFRKAALFKEKKVAYVPTPWCVRLLWKQETFTRIL